jgi:hypothetical protein
VDASAFLLGHSPTSGRDHVIHFGSDAGVTSANHEGRAPLQREHQRPDQQAQRPLVFDLIDDPAEEWDLMDKRLDCAWVLGPVARRLGR